MRIKVIQPVVAQFLLGVVLLLGLNVTQAAAPAASEHYQPDSALADAGRQLRENGQLQKETHYQLLQSADGLFLLGWLFEHGRYGVERDAEQGQRLIQLAAEGGSMAAAHYCWQRCLVMTSDVQQAIKTATDDGDALGLYLQAKWLSEQGADGLGQAGQLLFKAAKAHQPDALSELYLQHFLNWAGENIRTYEEAESKLTRCTDEGLSVCYLLLGSLYEKHRESEKALSSYLILQQLDYGWARQYLYADDLIALEQRLPTDSLVIVQARVATHLIHHPQTGFDYLDRYSVCADRANYDCVRRVTKQDDSCTISYFSDTYFKGFRDSEAYQRCMGF